jgi:uncharacterized protein YgiM (DUF1202 family)
MKRQLIAAFALLAIGAAAAAHASTGTVLRDDKLYSQPSATSKVNAAVTRGATVTIQQKQGGWLKVSAGKSSGWIRLLSVRAGAGGLGGAGVGDVVGVATTRSDPSRVVAVAGLRGLSDQELKQAKFNGEELARMEAQTVTAAQARSFAGQTGLVAANVPALPSPKPAQPASSWETQ